MKHLLLASLLMLPTQVWAQSLPPDTPLTLNITIAKADKIWRGLRKLPVEEVGELMNEIRQQVATQTAPKSQAPENKMGDITNNQGIVTQGGKPVEQK